MEPEGKSPATEVDIEQGSLENEVKTSPIESDVATGTLEPDIIAPQPESSEGASDAAMKNRIAEPGSTAVIEPEIR